MLMSDGTASTNDDFSVNGDNAFTITGGVVSVGDRFQSFDNAQVRKAMVLTLDRKAFIDILGANDEVIEGQRLFQEISARVTWAAEAKRFEQLPQYAPIKFGGHESGDFFFVPKG